MAFISLFLLWPIILVAGALSLLSIALPVIAGVLLVCNVLLLLLLLAVRHAWKKSGTMDQAYIDTLTGWKHVLLTVCLWGLRLLIAWEVFLVIASGSFMAWWPGLVA